MPFNPVLIRGAVPPFAAALVSFLITYALCVRSGVNVSPAILSAALAIGLARRPEELSLRTIAAKLLAMPAIAVGAGLVGLALLRLPVLGAVVFTAGIALSIALRQLGERGAAYGRVLALPFLAILIVPIRVDPGAHPATTALLVAGAGIIALACSALASYAGMRLRWLNPGRAEPKPARERTAGAMPVSTRMALQMTVALTLAFVIGYLAFPEHWFWIVLSAFIVCSGTIGRGDAVYKALLRLCGAVAGTLVAALFARMTLPNPTAGAALVFFVLFLGIWLRQVNYAYWAAAATLIFAMLQGPQGDSAAALFATRVLCIFIGALCGVLATWFVFPIRTSNVVRRRVADALVAMRETLAGEERDLAHHAAELARVAPPVRLHRAVLGAKAGDAHPATWIERTLALLARMDAPDYDRKEAGAEMRRLGALISREKP